MALPGPLAELVKDAAAKMGEDCMGQLQCCQKRGVLKPRITVVFKVSCECCAGKSSHAANVDLGSLSTDVPDDSLWLVDSLETPAVPDESDTVPATVPATLDYRHRQPFEPATLDYRHRQPFEPATLDYRQPPATLDYRKTAATLDFHGSSSRSIFYGSEGLRVEGWVPFF